MVAVRPAVGGVFVRGQRAAGLVFTLLEVCVAVLHGVLIAEGAVCIGRLRLEIRAVYLLDLLIQRLVRRSVVAARQHHSQRPAGPEQREGLRERDLFRDPLDGRGGVDEVEALFSEIVCDEVVVHQMKVWLCAVLLPQLRGQMFAELDRVI